MKPTPFAAVLSALKATCGQDCACAATLEFYVDRSVVGDDDMIHDEAVGEMVVMTMNLSGFTSTALYGANLPSPAITACLQALIEPPYPEVLYDEPYLGDVVGQNLVRV